MDDRRVRVIEYGRKQSGWTITRADVLLAIGLSAIPGVVAPVLLADRYHWSIPRWYDWLVLAALVISAVLCGLARLSAARTGVRVTVTGVVFGLVLILLIAFIVTAVPKF